MKKYFVILLINLFFITHISAVNIDSLKHVSKETTIDSVKIKTLTKLSEIYIDIDKDSAFMYGFMALNYAKEKKYTKGTVDSYKELGIVHFYSSEFKEARNNFKEAIITAININNYYLIANLYYLVGATYYQEDNYNKAIEQYKISLKIAKEHKFEDVEANCYNAIGILYKIQGNYTDAINYYLKSITIAEKDSDFAIISNIYNNIGVLYKNQELYDKAIEYYRKALHFKEKTDDKSGVINIYNNIGVIYKNTNKFNLALQNFNKAIKIAKQINDINNIYKVYINLGSLYKKQKKYNEAINWYNKAIEITKKSDNEPMDIYKNFGELYLDYYDSLKNVRYLKLAITNAVKAYTISEKTNNINTKQSSAGVLMHAYSKLGNTQKALKYALIYSDLIKKTYNINKLKEVNKLETKYKSEKNRLLIEKLEKEQQLRNEVIKRQQLENKLVKRQRIAFYLIVLTLILIVVYVTLSLRKNKKLNNELKKSSELLTKEYLKSIKQNIDIKTKSAEIEKQKLILQELNNNLTASEEELKQQNDILFQKNEKIILQRNKIAEVVKQFEDTINNLEDVYFKTDKNFCYTQASLSIVKYLKLDNINNIIGEPLTKYWNISDEELKKISYKIVRNKYLTNYNFTYINTKKEIRYAKVNARALFVNNKFSGVEGLIRDITKDILQKNKIEELNAQKETLLDNLPLSIYFKDKNLKYIEVNKSFVKMLGLTKEEIVGKTDKELNLDNLPSEYEEFDRQILKNKKIITNYERENVCPKGNTYLSSTTKVPYLNKDGEVVGIIGVVRDITEQKKHEIALAESEQKFKAITNFANDAIILIDNSEKIALWNKAAQNIFGYNEQEVISKNLHDILPPIKYKDNAHSAFINFRQTGKGRLINKTLEIEGLKKDGTVFPLEISISAIKIKNKWNAVGIIRDISIRKEHELALKESKEKIELAHKDITDNINYAKSIQNALLTSNEKINQYLSEFFILYMPRDQVSGDFYYVNKFNDYIVFAVADGTGHGVSGGFLTVLGITHLHDIVSNKEIDNPGKALNLLRKKIKGNFKTFGNENNNGFDIALCALNTKTNILSFAGANNPMWIIRNNEIIEYKPVRNPIGFYPKEIDFVGTDIKLQTNDTIYLFTDGYADQFGGAEDKKFTKKQLKKLLLSIVELPIDEQKQKLKETINNWKANTEQTDDITVMAIKI